MKNLIVLLSLLVSLVSCGDKSSSQNGVSKSSHQKEKLLACSVLSNDFIDSRFPGAIISQSKEGGSNYPNCGVLFKHNNIDYSISLTLGIIGNADEKYLELAVSHFKSKGHIEKISGVGEKAYNRTGGSGQLSAINHGNLIHVTVYNGYNYDLNLTKDITKLLFKKLDK